MLRNVLSVMLLLFAFLLFTPSDIEAQTNTRDTVVLATSGENITPAKLTLVNEIPAFATVYVIMQNGQRVRLVDLVGNETKTITLRKSYMNGQAVGFEVRSRVGEFEPFAVEYSNPIRYGQHLRVRLTSNGGSVLVRG